MSHVLVTGAGGEIGTALIEELSKRGKRVVAIDLNPLSEAHHAMCEECLIGDILDDEVIRDAEKYDLGEIYHLAALLSTSAEKNPGLAQRVNVEGTINFLDLAIRIGRRSGHPVKFLFPSTIAVYGFKDLADKNGSGKVAENVGLEPATMYGVNKLYNEQLGRYYSDHYMRLSPEKLSGIVDFRAVRYPGLISAFTIPTGGTSDYAPEMVHAAAQGKPYQCFVRPDTTIPFMAMPDGVRAIVDLAAADLAHLSRRVYNIGAFAPSAQDIANLVAKIFPDSVVEFKVDERRQAIVDSWCADVDDSAARNDWGWSHEYDLERTFFEYLAPNIRQRYS